MDRRGAEGRTVLGLEAAVKGKKNDSRETDSGAGCGRVWKSMSRRSDERAEEEDGINDCVKRKEEGTKEAN